VAKFRNGSASIGNAAACWVAGAGFNAGTWAFTGFFAASSQPTSHKAAAAQHPAAHSIGLFTDLRILLWYVPLNSAVNAQTSSPVAHPAPP
jgi:hypothetical protein